MRRGARAWRWGLLTGAVCLSAMTLDLCAQDTTVLAVVVPAGAEPEALEIAEVAQIFRRKKTLWSSGARIVPVNLPADHPLRLRFSRAVLRQSPQAMEDYWNQQYFQGVLPPHVLASERAVERFVIETANAVGYLPYCGLDPRLRAVIRIDAQGRVLDPDEPVACAVER